MPTDCSCPSLCVYHGPLEVARYAAEHHQGEHCQDCGREYGLMGWWRAPDDLWLRVTGRKYGGLYCPDCFGRRAQAKGILLRWSCEVDKP